jgi:SecD/SecF fusion protein
VRILRAGALPATLKSQPVSENTMGATLGEDTIFKGALSIGIAFAAVLIFMLIYYRFAGIVACFALMANLLLTIAFMVLVSATFTLPGLAGLVLMIGMAVDANVLIFERMKEELRSGKTLGAALEAGFSRALPSIRDSNACTIIICIVLYFFGSNFGASIIQGFAVTLATGVIISFLTAYFCSRVFLRTLLAFIPRAQHTLRGTRLRWLFGLEGRPLERAPLPAMAGASSSVEGRS